VWRSYYYGDYCQYCFYNRNMAELSHRWWLGADIKDERLT